MTRGKGRPSPYQWLWAEIERRYGTEAKQEMYDHYLEMNRAIKHEIFHRKPSPPQPHATPPKRRR